MPVKRNVPSDDAEDFTSFVFGNETYNVKKRFKVAKFLRTLSKEPVDAIEIALDEESFERFLELEISMDELQDFLKGLSEALGGGSAKN